MKWQLARGANRTVLLTNKWAIKFPGRYNLGWRNIWSSILRGLLCNMQEKAFSDCKMDKICPVRFYMPGGFFIIMPRASPISDQEWQNIKTYFYRYSQTQNMCIPVECKRDSFGVLDGRVVALDYGDTN